MSNTGQEIYEFGDFRLDIGKAVLTRTGSVVVLQRKSFELLCLLVRSGGNLLTRGELMDQLWGDTFVSDNNLSQQVRALRKALDDNGNGTKLIETVPAVAAPR